MTYIRHRIIVALLAGLLQTSSWVYWTTSVYAFLANFFFLVRAQAGCIARRLTVYSAALATIRCATRSIFVNRLQHHLNRESSHALAKIAADPVLVWHCCYSELYDVVFGERMRADTAFHIDANSNEMIKNPRSTRSLGYKATQYTACSTLSTTQTR